jgi:glutamate-1-semialdehyde 2,1-aminomutase
MAAADAVLDEVLEHRDTMYVDLHTAADTLATGFKTIFTELDVPCVIQHVGPMISIFLTDEPDVELASYRDVRAHGELERFVEFQHNVQRAGVFFHPNMFEPMYLSTAHTSEDVSLVLERVETAARRWLAA